jgi:hypothetical protein
MDIIKHIASFEVDGPSFHQRLTLERFGRFCLGRWDIYARQLQPSSPF